MTEQPLFPRGAAVVIGGSGGLGREICRRLAESGSDVALTYRANAAAGREAAEAVEAAGRKAIAEPLDLSSPDAVETFFGRVADELGGVHTVVFAVGADIPLVHAAEVQVDDWRRALDGDATGFFHVVRGSLPHLRAAQGSLVALSSAGVVRHPPKDVLSTVPKAAIEALVRAVAREEGRFGVRANTVALGVIDAGQFLRVGETLSEDYLAAIVRNTSLRRLGSAREVADAVVFLTSSRAGYVTGHRLVVDGGYSV